MLRRAQHERKIVNGFNVILVRPEPCRRVNEGFSAAAERSLAKTAIGIPGIRKGRDVFPISKISLGVQRKREKRFAAETRAR
jgi:hypothetical protein